MANCHPCSFSGRDGIGRVCMGSKRHCNSRCRCCTLCSICCQRSTCWSSSSSSRLVRSRTSASIRRARCSICSRCSINSLRNDSTRCSVSCSLANRCSTLAISARRWSRRVSRLRNRSLRSCFACSISASVSMRRVCQSCHDSCAGEWPARVVLNSARRSRNSRR